MQHEVYAGMGEDRHGNEIELWNPPVELGIYAFNPGGTAEPAGADQDRVISLPTIYVPNSAVVGPHDRFTVRGQRFDVEGDIRDFRNPYDSSMNGLSINLKGVAG
ncbi:hypothetical protein [Cryobacterium sp. BB736]|uniref:hypothetical protein n=1 Tax=Cryobacterium sp. BB736 TaxID=2746963 RepID=UPI001874B937|nr:hypothetical protein [Cryobacterium sp. BB736]